MRNWSSSGIGITKQSWHMPNERRTAMSKPWTVGKVRLFRPPDEILDVRRRDVETILEGNTEEPWQVFWSEKEWRNRPVFFTEDDLRFLQSINVIGGNHVDEPDGIVNSCVRTASP